MPVLVVDNLSPFTPDILSCLDLLGADYACLAYSKVSTSDLVRSSNVILSGRRKNSREINVANSRIVKHCFESGKPLLGICYGAEIIALTLGGTIRRMQDHVHGRIDVKINTYNPLTDEKATLSVYESHAYCVGRLPAEFTSLASSETSDHEMFSHIHKPVFGTQFHPEKSGVDGKALLECFARIKEERFYLHEKKT